MDSGAILTAVVAASAASLAAVVTKDAKVSEFRQQWIDSLREDIASYCSVSVSFYWAKLRYTRTRPFDKAEDDDVKFSALEELNRAMSLVDIRIKLRLDPAKIKAQDLILVMDKLTDLASTKGHEFEEVESGVKDVLSKSQLLLDEAWERVKRGERRFQSAIWISFTSLLISVAVALLHWVAQHSPTLHSYIPWI